MDMAAIMARHIEDVIEKCEPAFGGLPVCPFARRARLSGRIRYETAPFGTAADLVGLGRIMTRDHDVMVIMHPGEVAAETVEAVAKELCVLLLGDGLTAFYGHPDSGFSVGGVFCRRDPFPNVQIVWADVVKEAQASLPAKYYRNWSADRLAEVQATLAGRSGGG